MDEIGRCILIHSPYLILTFSIFEKMKLIVSGEVMQKYELFIVFDLQE